MAARRYQIAGLALESAIDLPELPRAGPAPAGWSVAIDRVRRRTPARWSHHWREADGRLWLSIGRAGDEYVLRFARSASFRVSLARCTIHCEGASRLPADTVRHLLLNQVLPLVLGADRIVLHASAVRTPFGAVAFAGPGGSGKSTLAAALSQSGMALLSDDAVILERRRSVWHARALYGSLRLWPDAAEALFGSRVRTGRVAHYTRKRRIEAGQVLSAGESGAPLAAIGLLDTAARATRVSARRLSMRDALVALTRVSFHLDIQDRARWVRIIEELGRAAEAIPVLALSYPRRMRSLAATAREVLAAVESAIAAS